MIKRLTGTDRKDSFLELLLDETLCAGKIMVPETWVREAGGFNPKLNAKKNMNCYFGLQKNMVLQWKR